MTDIYIISGFLGAGKTTLIQHLLKNVLTPEETVVIENDFGEISMDTALIQSGGFTVKELSSGCICCSLTGDFIQAILEVIGELKPKQIIIEPSGVGKLSDIEAACLSPKISAVASIRRKITVADVLRCSMYLENFGEFYEDQIQHADSILLSRGEKQPERAKQTAGQLAEINPHAEIFSGLWEDLNFPKLLGLSVPDTQTASCSCVHSHNEQDDCGHTHHHHDCCEHDSAEGRDPHHAGEPCRHDHSAQDAFDTITLELTRTITEEELKTAFKQVEELGFGHILRAKGILNTPQGAAAVQYLPGELSLTPCSLAAGPLCLIGSNFDRQGLSMLLGKGG